MPATNPSRAEKDIRTAGVVPAGIQRANSKGRNAMAKQKNEEEIRAQYPDVVEGSLTHVKMEEIESMLGQEIAGREIDEQAIASLKRIVPKGEKRVVLRPCAETGELFFLATSDLHQSVHSPEVRKVKQRAKAKERKKARNATLKAENEQLRAELGSLEQEAEAVAS